MLTEGLHFDERKQHHISTSVKGSDCRNIQCIFRFKRNIFERVVTQVVSMMADRVR